MKRERSLNCRNIVLDIRSINHSGLMIFSLKQTAFNQISSMHRLSFLSMGMLLGALASAQPSRPQPPGTPAGAPLILSEPRSEEWVNGFYYRYLTCDPLPSSRRRAALESEGVHFISYVGNQTYLVALPEGFSQERLSLVHVRRLRPVQAEEKMHRNLREQPYGSWALDGDRVHVYAQVYPQVRMTEAAAHFRSQGYEVVEVGNQNGFLHLLVPQVRLSALADLPFVRYLELMPPPSVPEDVNGRSWHRSGLLDMDSPLGRRYDGSGVAAIVRDDGPLGPHIDFKGRYIDYGAAEAGSDGTHGDGVAGILGGAGNLDPRVRGMAAGVQLYTVRYWASFQDATLALHETLNATITNSSYSNGCNAGYTLSAQTVETQLYQFPTLMHVFSAGNDGQSDCNYGAGPGWGNITGGHKVAKNAIAVANLRADGTLMPTSSRGPVHDGRLKPDLTAHGQGQRSATHDNDYQTFGGTSAAAPGVAGVLAQLTQAYKEHFNGEQPPAALLKAVLLNTAGDMGHVGPDFRFGWGLVNAWRAYRLLVEKRWLQAQADHQTTEEHTLVVPPGVRQGRIMLYWADPPAEAGAKRALINDLDLQVIGPDNSVYMPWVLNPSPDPVALDTPAQFGRDSLNNAEQVALIDPTPGVYTVRVSGYEVPLGPQSYFLAWDFEYDSLKLVYPAGGEGLAPGDTCRIHWDAYGDDLPFVLDYSLDDGQSWWPIATVEGDRRWHDWSVPTVPSGRVRVRVSRGGYEDRSELPLSIVAVPTDLMVERVCLDSATLSWKPLSDTLRYDVYLLGERYMELVTTVATPRATVFIAKPQEELWFSVRASTPSGLAGRRAVAASWSGGLKECAQPYDLALKELLSPRKSDLEAAVSCAPTTWTVQVRIANEGTLPANGAAIFFQLNDAPPVSEGLPELAPGNSLVYTFTQPMVVAESGVNRLRVWTSLAPEMVFFNDTLTFEFRATVETLAPPLEEDFEGAMFPPLYWSVVNPDGDVTWLRYPISVVGPDGLPTTAVHLSFFSYPETGEKDYLYLPPVELPADQSTRLVFHWAHANYSADYADSLRVEVFPGCSLQQPSVVLWERGGTSLATRPPQTSPFTPTAAGDWRQASIPLDSFAGKSLVIRLTGVNDYGNNLFLDNIGIVGPDTTLPQAAIQASVDTACRSTDTVRFWVASPNVQHQYSWSFGTGSQPNTASGPGPHRVRFLVPGTFSVRLIASNQARSDTGYHRLHVIGTATANFSWVSNGQEVAFTNLSTHAEQHEWDFGDGNTSTTVHPVHTYAEPGEYSVTLRTRNRCSATPAVRQQNVMVVVSTAEPQEVENARIVPNPNNGLFAVELVLSRPTTVRAELFDACGRLREAHAEDMPAGKATIFMGKERPLEAGIYLLQVRTATGTLARRVVVAPQ